MMDKKTDYSKITNIHGLEIGDIGLRRDTNDRWKKFIVNFTYLPLIAEFPEDYRPLFKEQEEK